MDILMLDDLHQTFLMVCQEKSYTQAAKRLYISQPAVSQHIQKLEEHYQTQLFTYQHRKLTLTPKGTELYTALIKIQGQITQVQHQMALKETEPSQLRLASTLSISDSFLPSILTCLSQHYPSANLSCYVENTTQILTRLVHGEIDFAFVEGNFPKDDFAYQILSSEKYIPIASRHASFSSEKIYELSDLFHLPLITREPGSGTRHILDNVLHEFNSTVYDFKRVFEISNIQTIKSLVKANQGISFIYQTVVLDELKKGELIQIPLKQIQANHNFYFIYLKDSIFESHYLHLFQTIKNHLKKD